jgi:hypothetical protein
MRAYSSNMITDTGRCGRLKKRGSRTGSASSSGTFGAIVARACGTGAGASASARRGASGGDGVDAMGDGVNVDADECDAAPPQPTVATPSVNNDSASR